MSSDNQSPLSLEDQCHLYLILHLEDYLPEELSLLSLKVRERLLVNLPAADICKLEETTVVQGVDMNGVWKKVGQRQLKRRYHRVCASTNEALKRGEGYRDHFYEVASHMVLFGKVTRAVRPLYNLLYTVVECLGVSDWQSSKLASILRSKICCCCPPHYEQHFEKDGVHTMYTLSALMLVSCMIEDLTHLKSHQIACCALRCSMTHLFDLSSTVLKTCFVQ